MYQGRNNMKKILHIIFIAILTVTLTACSSSSVKKNLEKGVKTGIKKATSNNDKNSNSNNTENTNNTRSDYSIKENIEYLAENIKLERSTAEIMVLKSVKLSTDKVEGTYDVYLVEGNMELKKDNGDKYRDSYMGMVVFNEEGKYVEIKDKDEDDIEELYTSNEVVYHERNGKVKINKL